VSLGGFLMLGSNFIELQNLSLELDGAPRVSGTFFLPISFQKWRASRSLWAALDEAQKFDVALEARQLDLGGLANALGEESALTGVLDGKLAAFGLLPQLQVTTNWRLANLGSYRSANAIEFQGRYLEERADVEASATFDVSQPVRLRASIPLRLEKSRLLQGEVVDHKRPFSIGIGCPALFLEDLPNELRFGAEKGLLSGEISFSSTMEAPVISGEADLLEAKFWPPPPWPAISALTAHVQFGDRAAVIDPLRFEINAIPSSWRGRLSASLENFGLLLTPDENPIEVDGSPPAGANLSAVRFLGKGTATEPSRLVEALLRGRIGSAASLTTVTEDADDGPVSRATFFIGAKTRGNDGALLLRVATPAAPPGFQLQIARPTFRFGQR
ncbi:MAG TPA: hypothetical protein VLI42_08390, partial [Chthoniobacterales bacterium]|nr:hypothetical protein [Chthoniobacterales bacterium]